MSDTTGIAWCDATFNVAWGCAKVSAGCANCYAERDSKRYGFSLWGPAGDRRTFGDKHWNEPLKWAKKWAASGRGRRMRIFTSSMADVFEDHPTIEAQLPRLFDLIRATPDVDWLILTKRVERMKRMLPYMNNVWAIASVEDHESASERLPDLLQTQAPILGVSYEPALAAVDFRLLHPDAATTVDALRGTYEIEHEARYPDHGGGLEGGAFPGEVKWVIVGGESGFKRREMPMAAVLNTVDACRAAGVAVFVKQDSSERPGAWGRIPREYRVREFPVTA